MKKNTVPQFIGVIVSLIVIWLVNDLILVDKCLDQGGTFLYASGECLLENGEIYTSAIGKYLIAIYFFIGLLVALSTSYLIQKLLKIKP